MLLGTILLLTRLAWLGHGLNFDELQFLDYFVRAGPGEILTSNSLGHQLYGLLSWLTTSVIGESYIALRLWSAVPFILGVGLVAAWLHVRHDPLAGVLFLFLATVSPLLLDITRQARGYGLAFLAMAVVIVGALEAVRTGRVAAVVAMCAGGIVGTWTLPQVGIAFIATLVVLLIDRRLRVPAAIGLLVSIAACVAWYLPHLTAVQSSSQTEVGERELRAGWLVTAPFDQMLLPALIWIDGAKITASAAWLPFVVVAALVMASSPFVTRREPTVLILCAGPITTAVALWLANAYVTARYFSSLLVPLFMLLASGAAAILRNIPAHRAAVRTVICLGVLGALALNFARIAPDVIGLPREALREAARVIETRTQRTTPVYASLPPLNGLRFYLDRSFEAVEGSEIIDRVCRSDHAVVYVLQPWLVSSVNVPCLARRGVEHYRFEQYARGREIHVWLVPPQPERARARRSLSDQ